MAIVTNDPKTMPAKILVKTQEEMEAIGIIPAFLDYCVKPAFKAGVKRKSFWILKTDSVVRTDIPPDHAYANFYKLMQHAYQLGFSMIQIIAK